MSELDYHYIPDESEYPLDRPNSVAKRLEEMAMEEFDEDAMENAWRYFLSPTHPFETKTESKLDSGWDTLFQYNEDDIDALERYAG